MDLNRLKKLKHKFNTVSKNKDILIDLPNEFYFESLNEINNIANIWNIIWNARGGRVTLGDLRKMIGSSDYANVKDLGWTEAFNPSWIKSMSTIGCANYILVLPKCKLFDIKEDEWFLCEWANPMDGEEVIITTNIDGTYRVRSNVFYHSTPMTFIEYHIDESFWDGPGYYGLCYNPNDGKYVFRRLNGVIAWTHQPKPIDMTRTML